MNFSLETPAMIFPAISLLMLAYTNRFVVLADLIRDLYEQQKKNPNSQIMQQIENLQVRMQYIKIMQVLGAIAFMSAAVSMLAKLLNIELLAWIMLFISLGLLILSLFYLLKELFQSITALNILLDDLKPKK